jgi:uncharacterized protein (TIGR03382 family)
MTFFRNKVRGQPDPYGYWREGVGILLGSSTDRQNVVANMLINGSDLVIDHEDGQVEDLFIEGNVVDGSAEWDTLEMSSALPDSLYRDAPPRFWPSDMVWPPFGPDIEYAATNQVPAERRYWEGDPMGSSHTPQPPGDAGVSDAGTGDAGQGDVGQGDAGQGDVGAPDTGSLNADVGSDAAGSNVADAGSGEGSQVSNSADEKDGCGCAASGDAVPGSVALLLAWIGGWLWRRRSLR